MYIKKFPDKAKKLVGGLYYNDYGLRSFGKCIAEATAEFKSYDGKAVDWLARNTKLEDLSGKKIVMPERVFKRHTSGKYEAPRVPLLDSVPDVLKHPDEVWMNDYVGAFNNINYIKFYQGKCINVICSVEGGSIQVETWFEIRQIPKGKLKRSKDPRWRYRRGLLIKK